MNNIPVVKAGIVAVSRDCFPESLSVNRRKALVDAYAKKYDAAKPRLFPGVSFCEPQKGPGGRVCEEV